MRTMTRSIWALLALLAVVPSAAAQTDPYPSRPICFLSTTAIFQSPRRRALNLAVAAVAREVPPSSDG